MSAEKDKNSVSGTSDHSQIRAVNTKEVEWQ